MKSLIKKTLLCVFFLVVILFIAIGVFILFINGKDNGKYFSTAASHFLHQPVIIQHGNIALFSASPTLILNDTTIFSSEQKPLLHLNKVKVSINFYQSLLKREWVVKEIALSNIQLHADKNASSTFNVADIFSWIESQPTISFKVEDTDFHFCRSKNICLDIEHINLHFSEKKILIRALINHRETNISSDLKWNKNQDNFSIMLNSLDIQSRNARFFGKSEIQFKSNQFISLSTEGNGSAKNVNFNKIKLIYTNKLKPELIISGIIQSEKIKRLFLSDIPFQIQNNNHIFSIKLKSPNLAGIASIDTEKKSPARIQLSRFSIQLKKQKSRSAFRFIHFPAFTASIRDLIVNDHPLGKLHFTSKSIRNGMFFNHIKLNSTFSDLSGNGGWLKNRNIQKVYFNGNIKSQNFGYWLEKAHGIPKIKDGVFSAQVSLTSSDAGGKLFSLERIKGNIDFSLENATVLTKDKDQSTSIIDGIINLVSLKTISNFLTLNFKKIKKEKGFKIFYLKGKCDLNNGFLSTQNVEMSSPVAKINFSGKVDLKNQRNYLNMSVYPNIISTYHLGKSPLVILIRLPVWIAKKIASLFINPLFHMDYTVTGTLSKPIVKKK